MLPLHPSALGSLRLVELLAAITCIFDSAQQLTLRALFLPGELASWQGTSRPWLRRMLRWTGLRLLMGYRATLLALAVTVTSALVLAGWILSGLISSRILVGPVWPVAILPLAALVPLLAAKLLFHVRATPLLQASDQYSLTCLLIAVPAEALHSSAACTVALLFLAGMAALSYGTAGFLKLTRRGWFDGSYARYVLSTASFGAPSLHRLYTRYPALAAFSGGTMVLGECLLSAAALLPPGICAALLGFGVLLHLGLARVLGLNTYVWAFAALYPATYFVSTRIHAGL